MAMNIQLDLAVRLVTYFILLSFGIGLEKISFLNEGDSSLRRSSSVSDQRTLAERRPDPVREVWDDMLVKIADLGNACWVVSCNLKKNYSNF